MTDLAPSLKRTGVPMGAGSVLVYVAHQLGLELTVDQALLLAPVVMFVYYGLLRVAESRWPIVGVFLGQAKAPAYSPEPAPSPGPGEDVEAVVVPDETGAYEIGFLGLVLIIVLLVLILR